MSYPIDIEVRTPRRFERVQLALRLAVAVALGFLGIEGGWVWSALYVLVPVIIAALVAARGADQFASTVRPVVVRALGWIVAFQAYMALVTDRLPSWAEAADARVVVRATTSPSIGSALLRLVLSIPSWIVMAVLAVVGCFLWVVSALAILFTETQPAALISYQRGLLRWQARLLAYHASLADQYPPFSFDTDAAPTPTSPEGEGR